jgi:hypothetical protein
MTEQTNNIEKASRQTHTQGNNKNNEGKWKKNTNANVLSVTTWKKAAKQNPSSI